MTNLSITKIVVVGLVATLLAACGPSPASAPPAVEATSALNKRTFELYDEMRSSGVQFEMHKDGILFVFNSAAKLEESLKHLEPLAKYDIVPSQAYWGKELRELEPALAPGLVACRLDIGYPVAPASATRAWAAAATHAGATFEVAEAALELDGDRVRGIRATGRRIDAAAVVVAAGSWMPAIVDPSGAWRPIRPFWGVVVEVQLARPPRHILEGAGIEDAIDPGQLRAARRPDEADGIVDFSLVTATGRSALGSTFLPFEPDPAEYLDRLLASGAAYVAEIERAPVLGLRACARPLSLDGRPLVGPFPGVDGLFVAAGHGPWGISTGPASGRHVAALIMGDGHDVPAAIREAVSPARFAYPQPEDTR